MNQLFAAMFALFHFAEAKRVKEMMYGINMLLITADPVSSVLGQNDLNRIVTFSV